MCIRLVIGDCGFDPCGVWQHSFVETNHEIFSMVIPSLPLIQEGQLSVSGKECVQVLLRELSAQEQMWLGELTALGMTLMG